MNTFWQRLHRPFFALAPMEDVTDAAFRLMFARHGKPDVLWTEFVAADGLLKADAAGKANLLKKLYYAPEERPIVAQLFTGDPESMEEGAKLIANLGFDGLDINMGCPDRSIEKQSAGASLIKNPDAAQKLIAAAKRGAGTLPVSVKTRIGYHKNEVDTWIPKILEMHPAALTIHARTRKEMSLVPAHWEDVARVVALRDELSPDTVIIGNGDVKSVEEGRQRVRETRCDGVMIGRGAFGNPWLFNEYVASPEERRAGLIEHLELFDQLLTGTQSFAVMKKHVKAYIHGWRGAKELRERLMYTQTPSEACKILKAYGIKEHC